MKIASRIKMAATLASLVRATTRPGAPSTSERAHAVPRLVRATLDGTYAGTTLKRLGLVAAAVAYVASPVDLLPEALLPLLGAADDAVVITWAIKAFLEETDRFIAWETGQTLHPSDHATAPGETGHDSTGAAAPGGSTARTDRARLPEGVRQAATDYVLESVRKRLER